MDYQGNSKKSKEKQVESKKQIEKVVTGEVVQKPKTIGRRFKDIFLGGDIKNAARYVTGDVLLPALRNLIVDVTSRGIERFVYGESMYRRRPTEYRPSVTYSNPINPTYRTVYPRDRPNLPDQRQRWREDRRDMNEIIFMQRSDAETVVENMIDAIEKYDTISLADYYELCGQPSSHVDNKWGWTYLANIQIRQTKDGFLIDLPPLEAL
jgi:hypothetical protein